MFHHPGPGGHISFPPVSRRGGAQISVRPWMRSSPECEPGKSCLSGSEMLGTTQFRRYITIAMGAYAQMESGSEEEVDN